MGLDIIFYATIVVAWTVVFIPYVITHKKYKLLGLVGAAMLCAQVFVAVYLGHRQFPFNYLAGVFNFCLSLVIGYFVYYFESKRTEE
jgi:hypothetical protein